MMNAKRSITRLLLSGAALLALSISSRPSAPAAPQPQGTDATARWAPEVRLRKLHLVRPDLIPYPIEYEVYC